MKKARRAFTLVELLIVIIIIGTLAGMMMLAAGSATAKAEATKIVANLRTLKSAVMMYEAENGPFPNDTIIYMDEKPNSLDNYLDNSGLSGAYFYLRQDPWSYVAFAGETAKPQITKDSDVWKQILMMADSAGLYISSVSVSEVWSLINDPRK